MIELAQVDIRREDDVVRAHQTARSIAAQLGFSTFEQTRIATATSEICRNALIYAGSGTAELGLADDRRLLCITVYDHGPGMPDVDAVLRGEARSSKGLGIGISGARRLMDSLSIDSNAHGTRVVMSRRLPRHAPAPQPAVDRARAQAAGQLADDPRQEIHLLQRDVAERDHRIVEMAAELADTNRGVIALSAELEQRAEYLREAIDLKTRLVSELGHELRTPLHSILQISQFLIDHLDGPLTAEQDRQVRIIHEVATATTTYVNDLLDLSKAEAGKIPVHPTRFPISQLFATLRRVLLPLATNAAVALRFEPPPPDLAPLETDESKLSQILRNLIANALKFTERGSVTVRARAAAGDIVVIEVVDTGIGIDTPDLETIFEEFSQVEGPIQRITRGTGLGLPLSRRLAGLLGGGIAVESVVGAGSTFRLSVPRVYTGEIAAEAPSPELPSVTALPVAGRPPILVIDDDQASRYVLRRWLEDRYEVVEAAGGQDGLRQADARPPAVIFLDVVMSDLTGFEVLDRLQENPRTRSVPVIVYSALSLGANDRRRLERAVAILRKSTASRVADRSAIEAALVKAGVATMLESRHG